MPFTNESRVTSWWNLGCQTVSNRNCACSSAGRAPALQLSRLNHISSAPGRLHQQMRCNQPLELDWRWTEPCSAANRPLPALLRFPLREESLSEVVGEMGRPAQ